MRTPDKGGTMIIAIIALSVCIVLLVVTLIVVLKMKKRDSYSNNNELISVRTGELVNDNALGKSGSGLIYAEHSDEETIVQSHRRSGGAKRDNVQVCLLHIGTQERYNFIINTRIIIGSLPANGDNERVEISAYGISRSHCMFSLQGNRLVVQDLNSRNHTYLNGQMVMQPEFVVDGSALQLGNEVFVVRII